MTLCGNDEGARARGFIKAKNLTETQTTAKAKKLRKLLRWRCLPPLDNGGLLRYSRGRPRGRHR
ncbi:hypothetical protein CEP54_006628 [Fusarium duplospermum]|uniref:Uncharacterized protein n=1 Tax=Fusarium duplospermum TaxID=1325734 RepID=A0A428Q5T7_9HYPO|nr:hypothetical protein CEP54_006628 [Fusarium duplospermum]